MIAGIVMMRNTLFVSIGLRNAGFAKVCNTQITKVNCVFWNIFIIHRSSRYPVIDQNQSCW